MNPNAICKSWTERPAALRRCVILAPVRAKLIVGMSNWKPSFLNDCCAMCKKKPLAFDQDKRLHNSEREIQADQFIRSTWYQSNHILLLILIWAHFTKAIFLALEDSLPLAHIEDSGRDGLHGVIPFCRVLFLASKGTIPHLFGFVIQLVVKSLCVNRYHGIYVQMN